jgi:hypothetical protein
MGLLDRMRAALTAHNEAAEALKDAKETQTQFNKKNFQAMAGQLNAVTIKLQEAYESSDALIQIIRATLLGKATLNQPLSPDEESVLARAEELMGQEIVLSKEVREAYIRGREDAYRQSAKFADEITAVENTVHDGNTQAAHVTVHVRMDQEQVYRAPSSPPRQEAFKMPQKQIEPSAPFAPPSPPPYSQSQAPVVPAPTYYPQAPAQYPPASYGQAQGGFPYQQPAPNNYPFAQPPFGQPMGGFTHGGLQQPMYPHGVYPQAGFGQAAYYTPGMYSGPFGQQMPPAPTPPTLASAGQFITPGPSAQNFFQQKQAETTQRINIGVTQGAYQNSIVLGEIYAKKQAEEQEFKKLDAQLLGLINGRTELIKQFLEQQQNVRGAGFQAMGGTESAIRNHCATLNPFPTNLDEAKKMFFSVPENAELWRFHGEQIKVTEDAIKKMNRTPELINMKPVKGQPDHVVKINFEDDFPVIQYNNYCRKLSLIHI